MLFLPTPFLVSFMFAVMAGLTYWHRKRNDQKQNYLFLTLILVSALQSSLLGWRLGYGIDAFRFLSPILAACVPPLVYRLVLDLVGVNPIRNFRVWHHAPMPLVVVGFLAVVPFLIDPFLIAVFVVYAVIILQLMRAGTNSLLLASLEDARAAYVSIMFAAFSLLISALIDGVIFFEFLLAGGQRAMVYITVANISSLIIITVAAFGIASHQADAVIPEDADSAVDSDVAEMDSATQVALIEEEEHEKTLTMIENLLVSKRLYRDVNLNLDRLARRLGMPARRVSSAINQLRGKNVSQFVNEFRVMEACDRLLKTDQSVTDIMFSTGFQTKSNFNREFRRVTGKTPRNWRNEKKPELELHKTAPEGFFADDPSADTLSVGRLN